MPRYDFRCQQHGTFEALCSHTKLADMVCPECGSPAQRIWLSTSAIIIRPDGWLLSPSDPNYSSNLVDKSKPEAWKVHA